jgi:hypothetical protein
MDLHNRLKGLSRDVLVEAVYLARRYIRHGHTWDTFLRQLQADSKPRERTKAVGIVRAIVADIETAEETDISALSPDRQRFHLSLLHTMLTERIPPSADIEAVDADLAELRSMP